MAVGFPAPGAAESESACLALRNLVSIGAAEGGAQKVKGQNEARPAGLRVSKTSNTSDALPPTRKLAAPTDSCRRPVRGTQLTYLTGVSSATPVSVRRPRQSGKPITGGLAIVPGRGPLGPRGWEEDFRDSYRRSGTMSIQAPATMDLLTNAIESLRVGVEDYQQGDHGRLLAAVRSIHAGILLPIPLP